MSEISNPVCTQLRVAVVHNSMNLGGTETSLLSFLRYLVAKGCAVDLYLGRPAGPLIEEVPNGVNLVRGIPQTWLVDVFATRPLGELLTKSNRSTPRLLANYVAYRILRLLPNPWFLAERPRSHYDLAIAYCNSGFSPRFTIDRVKARRKVMWWHHGFYKASSRHKRWDDRYYSQFDAVITVAVPTKEMIERAFPHLGAKVSVIPNLIDYDRIRKLAQAPAPHFRSRDRIRIVTVGRLQAEKGIDIAIRAASLLSQAGRDFDWYILGDSLWASDFQHLAADLGVSSCVHFLGPVVNPFPYVSGADIYVQPSRVEAHPLGVLEAMALAKPIVAADIPAIRALLKDQDLGVLTECSEGGIADGIVRFMNDPSLRSSYADRLRDHQFSSTATEERIDAILRWSRAASGPQSQQ